MAALLISFSKLEVALLVRSVGFVEGSFSFYNSSRYTWKAREDPYWDEQSTGRYSSDRETPDGC